MRPETWRLVAENLGLAKADGSERKPSRLGWLKAVVMVVVALLWSRAFFLQVVLGERQEVLAEGNRLERRVVRADRGVIKDSSGMVLARNGIKDGEQVREYPLPAAAAVVGYVGEGEEAGSIQGKLGVEWAKDSELRGSDGEELVEVNAQGQQVRLVGRREPGAGRVVELNLDGGLQAKIVASLRGRTSISGAVVVSRVEDGGILALVSWPSFDPNVFSAGTDEERATVLTDEENKPLFNRAIGGAYPPGSVFKLVTAAAGLEEGKIDGNTLVEDIGEIKIGPYRYGNWYFDQYGRTEGVLDVTKALARSNDIFFYKVGEWLGMEKLEDWAQKLGLGKETGIDLPGEVAGRVPDRLWKEKLTGERWFLGNTYHLAIGQGDVTVTPLQVNRMTAAVVGGRLCRPLVVKGEADCTDLGLEGQTRDLILEGMKAACSQGGTAFPFFDFDRSVACKTGTAQHGGEKTLPHAWITLVLPDKEGSYEKGVALTVLLEEAGEGSYEAGPVARQIVDYLVSRY